MQKWMQPVHTVYAMKNVKLYNEGVLSDLITFMQKPLYRPTRLQLMWIESVESVLPLVGDFLFWLVIFFGFVLSLKVQIERFHI